MCVIKCVNGSHHVDCVAKLLGSASLSPHVGWLITVHQPQLTVLRTTSNVRQCKFFHCRLYFFTMCFCCKVFVCICTNLSYFSSPLTNVTYSTCTYSEIGCWLTASKRICFIAACLFFGIGRVSSYSSLKSEHIRSINTKCIILLKM